MTTPTAGSTTSASSVKALALGCVLPLCAVLLLLTGCERPTDTPEPPDLSGTYTLASVDGKDLPATIAHEGATLEVRSGAFTINADGTCSSIVVFVAPSGTEIKREVSATYTREGSTLHMQWQGAGKTTGTADDNTFTMNNEGLVFLYRR